MESRDKQRRVPADWKPIDPSSILTLRDDVPTVVKTGPTWETTKPWTAQAGWEVVIREETSEYVYFDLINGSLYRARRADFHHAVGRVSVGNGGQS